MSSLEDVLAGKEPEQVEEVVEPEAEKVEAEAAESEKDDVVEEEKPTPEVEAAEPTGDKKVEPPSAEDSKNVPFNQT